MCFLLLYTTKNIYTFNHVFKTGGLHQTGKLNLLKDLYYTVQIQIFIEIEV